jgi:beta-lactamase regulating signal transducer with metallopeptidase domain
MNTFSYEVLIGLLRTTLFLSVASGLAYVLLRISRCRSPRVHRIVWCAVLLQGWLLAQVPWTIAWSPWIFADERTTTESAEAGDIFTSGGLPDLGSTAGNTSVSSSALTLDAPTPKVVEQPTQPSSFELLKAWWPTAVTGVWLIGIVVVLSRNILNYVQFVQRLSRSAAGSDEWQSEFEAACESIHPRKNVSLFVTDNLGPLLCRRRGEYLLVVPQSLWHSLTSSQRIAIVHHELAHYRRGDLWKCLAVRFLALPHWFNPLAWFAVRRFDEAAEWACDEVATSDRVPATEYANALLKLCDARPPQHAFLPAARGSSVSRRIRRLLLQAKEDSAMKKIMVCSVVALVLAIGVFRVELVGEEVTADANPSRQVTEMIDAAKKAFSASQAAYDAGTITMDNVYVWSRHWLQASLAGATNQKQRLDGYLDHRARMMQLFKKTSALFHAGSKGGEADKYYATKFYVAEAETWLFDKFGKEFEPIPPVKLTPLPEPGPRNAAISIDLSITQGHLFVEPKADGKEMPRGGGGFDFELHLPLAIKLCVDLCKERGARPEKVQISIRATRDTKYADVKNLIDACEKAGFKKIKLESDKAAKEPADKQSQILQLYRDLTGMPPTQAKIDEFVKDPSPQAYQNLVDHLLKSEVFEIMHPHLDIARFFDTHQDVVKADSCVKCHSESTLDTLLRSHLDEKK